MLIFLDLYFNSNVYRYNSSLTDLCSVSLLLDNGLISSYFVYDNAYNPTQQDIIDGNCSQ